MLADSLSGLLEDPEAIAAREQASAAIRKSSAEKAAIKEALLKPLLAELGGESPQTRAIAEGLYNQGITSTKNIGTTKDPSGATSFFNKTTGASINPNRVGIYDVVDNNRTQGNIFFNLNADDQGNVSFAPEWSPRAHGVLRDNPIGQAIMTLGSIIPSPVQPFFAAANAGDALFHGQYDKALLKALPALGEATGITDALKSSISDALGFGPSGLDMGDVIPQGGIAHLMPEEIANLTASRLIDASADNPMGFPYTGAVDYIPLDAIKQTSNFVNATGPVDGSPLDVSEADQAFQKLTSPYDIQAQIDSLTAQDIATAGTNPQDAINRAAGLDINDNQFTTGTPGGPGQLPVNWSPEVTLEDIINSRDLSLQDIVGSDWSAGTPTTGMEGNLPADLTNYYNSMNELAPSLTELTNNSLTQPNTLTTNNVIDNSGSGTTQKFDLQGRPITEDLTLDKVLDFGKAYLDNPAALAGVVGTGLAATGLVNNVINPTKTAETNTGTTTTTAPVASMVPVGPTPGLQDLFNYADLYKSSPFAQQQTQQQPPGLQAQYPGFTVSDVFRSLMADAPQQKIEPNLVGLADLQKQMARK
jgi:hypothetical protein